MKDIKVPFAWDVRVGHISANPVSISLKADEKERAALAGFWEIEAVEKLEASLQLTRWKRDGVKMKGEVRARIVQACVLTLEPVVSDIREEVEVIFVPEGSKLARIPANDSGEMILDPDGPDMPELFTGDSIDVGAAVAEQVALAIDPYPRKPGASFGERIESTVADDKKPNPFAVLQGLKAKDKG
ncbi:Uncharacterized metal-binding protein YceD, DUF177 family [Rhizobium sp. RU20A]|uniref:YceD family protein n=1 Tax=Rhizobium sp. RU20A TaxID=1907412 RepID=UPI000956970C|nr:DUF177 domain-containing protein [Rhizobium sp. RU20A]SIP95465.1 Uncharacterized metal-binding protein YceD, DUF177 family [Rhizobium sp. RU20A]